MSKPIWGYFLGKGTAGEMFLCVPCYEHENDASPIDLEGEPDTALLGVGAKGCWRCGRYAYEKSEPVKGVGGCSCCGCFGEDAKCSGADAGKELAPAVKAVPKRANRRTW